MFLRVAVIGAAFFVLRRQLDGVAFGDLAASLRGYGLSHVVLALAFTAASFVTLGLIELLALGYVGKRAQHIIPKRTALVTAFIANAYSQSVGLAILTGTAVRIRSYSRFGLEAIDVTRLSVFATITAALGLVTTGAIACMLITGQAPFVNSALSLMALGILLLLPILAYITWGAFGRAEFHGRGRWRIRRPSLRLALKQIGVSSLDWVLAGTVLFFLIPASLHASYSGLVGIYLIAQTVAVLSHVPGGLGVFEAIIIGFLTTEGGARPGLPPVAASLAASLLAYRIIYYLVPLCGAIAVSGFAEAIRSRKPFVPLDRAPLPPAQPQRVTRLGSGATRALWAATDPEIVGTPDCEPNRVAWLIDNGATYDALVESLRNARESIWISQLAFDADCRVHGVDGAKPERVADGELLLASITAASEDRSVDVKILVNATLLLDTGQPLVRFLQQANAGAGRIEVRGISRFPQLLHAKMAIIDQREAFLIGSPFVNGYWDVPSHEPVDNRRPESELGGRPVHDVSVGLSGPAVNEVANIFARLWNGAEVAPKHGAPLQVSSPVPETAADADVRIVTTEPRAVRGSGDRGSTQTVDALLAGIDRARTMIYIEHQYLSSRPVAAALRRALDREHSLEIILLLNQNPDVTAYRSWQNARLAENGLLGHPRVGVFALWTAETQRDAITVNQVFVHSKVVIVDDEWAMVGSANLDGASLDSYGDDFSGRIARRVFRDVRNFDVSLVLQAGRNAGDPANPIRELRRRLWTEHLDQRDLTPGESVRRARLADWRRVASAHVARLDGRAQPADNLSGSFILPYSTRPRPRDQLSDVGVRDTTRIDLRFDPSWLEVNFSPNWVRNMFVVSHPAPDADLGARVAGNSETARLESAFRAFVQSAGFPCLGAKSVVRLGSYTLRAYGDLGGDRDAKALVADLEAFSANTVADGLSAFVAVFPDSFPGGEVDFERVLWQQLQLIHEADPQRARWGDGVSADPKDPHFSFSVGGRAFFVVGLHPMSSRLARRFEWPALVFNPHEQFMRLREEGRFEGLRSAIRARDVALQGNENPNLADFGDASEARQYSGRRVEDDWKCPFHRTPP